MSLRVGPTHKPDDESAPPRSPEAEETIKQVKQARKKNEDRVKQARSMMFDRIRKQFESDYWDLCEDTDKRCVSRVKFLISRLTCCRIEGVVGSAEGKWTFLGPGLEVVWSDGSTATLPMQALHELLSWTKEFRGYDNYMDSAHWFPVGITASQFAIFAELAVLLPWWLEETGGEDVYLA